MNPVLKNDIASEASSEGAMSFSSNRMKLITEAGELKGKRVFVRVDWNVPMEDGVVLDTFRIEKSLPTLEYLEAQGAKIIIATHLEEGTIEPLKQFLPQGAELLPNLRENPGEEANSEEFAKELAEKADIYVNDAFSVSHRNHASIVGVPKLLPSFAGLHLAEEVAELSKAFHPQHPFLFILGGAKIETKMPLLEKFLNLADEIFVAGLIAKPFSETELGKHPKISYPHGDITALDIDRETIETLKVKIENAEFVLWNGPVGKYENNLKMGTLALAEMIANSEKTSIVGGGDTLAAIKELDLYDKFTFVSTGGGAMLDFLANGTLPGIEALN